MSILQLTRIHFVIFASKSVFSASICAASSLFGKTNKPLPIEYATTTLLQSFQPSNHFQPYLTSLLRPSECRPLRSMVISRGKFRKYDASKDWRTSRPRKNAKASKAAMKNAGITKRLAPALPMEYPRVAPDRTSKVDRTYRDHAGTSNALTAHNPS